MVKVPEVGVIRTEALRASIGRRWTIGGKVFLVLTPSIRDSVALLRRRAQIVGPKDAPSLLWNCDVKPGDAVVEIGAGSGALTLALAHAVGASGRVTSYDIREDFLEVARANVVAAGFGDRVDFRLADARAGVSERDVDAFLVDIPDPWESVRASEDSLKPCGHFASYSPNVEQVSRTVAALRSGRFVEVRTVEIIEREIDAQESGTHPSFAALGHTGYLTFARKVLDTF